jgi:hypothetical protein
MRTISILGGSALLLVAIGGAVCWVTGFGMLSEMLIDGVPMFFEHGGGQTEISGRLVGALMLIVPLACAICSAWLFHSTFGRKDEHDA